MAWEVLTDVYSLNKDRLYVTYFAGNQELGLKSDEETKHIWLELGLVIAENSLAMATRYKFKRKIITSPLSKVFINFTVSCCICSDYF